MYWNELNPQKRIVSFKFDDSDLKKDDNNNSKLRLFRKASIYYVNLFFISSNIHGFNHLADGTKHFIERLLWAIAICLSIYGSVILGLSTWTRYQENPTVISVDREYKEWTTALPAVTLCPSVKINDSSIDDLMYNEFQKYTNAYNKNDLLMFFNSLTNATYGTFKYLIAVNDGIIPPEKYLEYIMLLNRKVTYVIINNNVDKLFTFHLTPTITELGLCYSYNNEIAPYNEYKYWIERNTTIFPRTGVISGSPLDGDIFIQISDMNFGFTGFVHSSYEFPDVACLKFSSPEYYYTIVNVVALSIHSSSELKYLSPKQRGCRFLDESNLDISPVYTYNTCRMQCRIDQAKKLCGCVPYFYKPLGNSKICDIAGMLCLDQYEDFLIKLRNTTGDKTRVNCGCYPLCDDTSYSVQDETKMESTQWLVGSNLKWGLVKYPKIRLKRNILFGFTDVLVSIGGNAGLFLGCSVLSFLEIIYFLTFQLTVYILQYKIHI